MTHRVTIKSLIGAAVLAASMTGTASATQPSADLLIGTWTIQGRTTENGIAIQIRIELPVPMSQNRH